LQLKRVTIEELPGARIDVREDKVAAWPSAYLGVEIKLGV
jgi:hypothetical protein